MQPKGYSSKSRSYMLVRMAMELMGYNNRVRKMERMRRIGGGGPYNQLKLATSHCNSSHEGWKIIWSKYVAYNPRVIMPLSLWVSNCQAVASCGPCR